MNFSWEKIHFDQWLRDSRYPEGRWRSFLSLVSSPLMPSSRALCSCLTCGVLLFIPSYVLWHRNPPSRLAEDLPFPLTPRMLFTPPLAPRNGSQVLGPHHKTVTSGFHDCPPPKGVTGKFLRRDPPIFLCPSSPHMSGIMRKRGWVLERPCPSQTDCVSFLN